MFGKYATKHRSGVTGQQANLDQTTIGETGGIVPNAPTSTLSTFSFSIVGERDIDHGTLVAQKLTSPSANVSASHQLSILFLFNWLVVINRSFSERFG